MIVVDNSAMVAGLIERGPRGDEVRARLSVDDIVVPELLDVELANTLRKRVVSGQVTAELAARALRAWAEQDVERVPHRALLGRVWELRHNLTAYDAAYVALAESIGASLITLDGGIAAAPGPRCAITLIS